MIKNEIENLIKDSLTIVGVKSPVNVIVEHPADMSFGDYSTSAALAYCKEFSISSRDLAERLIVELQKNKPKEIEKIEIAGTGFINFFLSKDFFSDALKDVLKKNDAYGKGNLFSEQKIIIEYTNPNPFKEFHIGHMMSNTIGETLSRLIEWNGAELKRANYQGDVGLHVACAVWGMKQFEKDEQHKGKSHLDFGKAYAYGAKMYAEDDNAKIEILQINKKIYTQSDPEINNLYDRGLKASLSEFEKIYKRLGTKFDFYFLESKTGQFGKEVVEKNKKIFEESEGAVIFKGEQYGLHTRVFINSEGLPTYEAKELGLAKIKHDAYPYNTSIVITGNEVNDYFRVLLKVMELVFPELASKTKHISHGMLRLPTGKMSSRTGDVITAVSLLDDLKEKLKGKIDETVPENEREAISEQAAIGALKYSILKQASGKDIVFDFEKSLSFEGDSGPYLQYTHARAHSVIEKAKKENIKESTQTSSKAGRVEKLLYRFPEVAERAAMEYAPHHLVEYLTELSSSFNSFYGREKIIDQGNPESGYRLSLTRAVSIILKNGLTLLGIPVPERM